MKRRLWRSLGLMGLLLIGFQNCNGGMHSTSESASSMSGISGPSVQLTWASPAGGQQEGYYLEQSLDGIEFTQIQSLPAGEVSAVVGPLTVGKTYYFRIKSYNAIGESSYTLLTYQVP